MPIPAASLLLLGLMSAALAQAPPAPAPEGGPERAGLAVGSTAALAAGAVWFLGLGDRLGSGDPAAMLMGAGVIGLAGAALGGATVAALDPDESRLDDRAFNAPLWVGLGSGGTAVLGETAPLPLSLSFGPRWRVGERVRLNPRLTGRAALGPTIEVDPRDGTEALRTTEHGTDVDVDVRWFGGADPADPAFDLIVRPLWSTRLASVAYADGTTRQLQRMAVIPAAGGRWYLSGRQAFEVVAGPRIDVLSWSGDATAHPVWGRMYLDAGMQIGFDHPGEPLGHRATSRLQARYVHSNFDGVGFNTGAVIGYFGPFVVDYTLRLRRRPTAWAVQASAVATVGEGGTAMLTLGLVPPEAR